MAGAYNSIILSRGRSSKSSQSLRFGSKTHVGKVREINEDSLLVNPPLFVVADGMGGHAAGEIASEIAVQTIDNCALAHPDADALADAVQQANLAIMQAAEDNIGREGMGTTVTAAMLEGERLVIAQVGDSRAYLLHQGRLQQITRDHSLVADMVEAGQISEEEARTHPKRSVITRALGSHFDTVPDIYELNVDAGDRLLLCSDGLSSMVPAITIENILTRTADPQQCANKLVDAALKAGGSDNITVIVSNVAGLTEAKTKKAVRKSHRTAFFIVLLAIAIIAAAGFGLKHWIDTAAYLGEQDGYVTIYRGVPGDILGYEFSTVERVSAVPVDALQPGVADRLRDGSIRTDSVDEAEKLVSEYAVELGIEDNAPARADASNARDGEAAGDGASASDATDAADANTDTTSKGQGA